MESDNNRIIFHIDVNSAYLSWSAADRLQRGETLDIRQEIGCFCSGEIKSIIIKSF